MERLTEKITNKETGEVLAYRPLPGVGNVTVYRKLGKYEDIGLSPEQVQQLKERDIAKRPTIVGVNGCIGCRMGTCPKCGGMVRSYMRFCDECGQRLDWSE